MSKRPTRRPWEPMRQGVVVAKPGMPALSEDVHIWKNDRFTVLERTNADGATWLSIRRNDRSAVRDWRFFQQIKNDICGPEREGAELYPAESRLVDASNQYHMWVLPAGERFPFGFEKREVADQLEDDAAVWGARQRRLA